MASVRGSSKLCPLTSQRRRSPSVKTPTTCWAVSHTAISPRPVRLSSSIAFMTLSSQPITGRRSPVRIRDRKSTRLNSSHTEIYTLSLHDALPIFTHSNQPEASAAQLQHRIHDIIVTADHRQTVTGSHQRSEEHTSELQSHRDLHSFPTRRSSDLHTQQSARGQCGSAPASHS